MCSVFKVNGRIWNIYYLEDEFGIFINWMTKLKIENKLGDE